MQVGQEIHLIPNFLNSRNHLTPKRKWMTSFYLVQNLEELLSDDEQISLHHLGDSTLITNINDDEDFSIFSIGGDGFLELVAENNEYMTTDNSINNHKKSTDESIETILEAHSTAKLTSSPKLCHSNSIENNTAKKIQILKIEYFEPIKLPNESPSSSSVEFDAHDSTVHDKENISVNNNFLTPPNQTISEKSDFVNPPLSEVSPEPCSSQTSSSYFRTPPKFPTPFKNAFYFPKKPKEDAKKTGNKKDNTDCSHSRVSEREAEKMSKEEKRKERLGQKNKAKIKTISKKSIGKKTKEADPEQITQEQLAEEAKMYE